METYRSEKPPHMQDIQFKAPHREPPTGTAFSGDGERPVLVPKTEFSFEEIDQRLQWSKTVDLNAPDAETIAAARLFGKFIVHMAQGKSLEKIGGRCLAFICVHWPDLMGEHARADIARNFNLSPQSLHQYIQRLQAIKEERRPNFSGGACEPLRTNEPDSH